MRISDWSSDVCSSDLIERAEERLGDREPGDGDRVAAVHHAREARVGGNYRRGRDVAAGAQILGERGRDEGVEIEPIEREGHGRKIQIGRASCRESVCQYV